MTRPHGSVLDRAGRWKEVPMTASVPSDSAGLDELVAAARAGQEDAFAVLAARYRGELRLHCYRMLGSLEDAEDLVQETFLRAWTKRASYAGRSTYRAWLYGVATHACLDALRQRRRRVLPPDVAAPADPAQPVVPSAELPWLEPYPDRLIDEAAAGLEPESALIARESTELAFLAAIQHLPPRQRAVLILRDVLDWPARQVADALDSTVAAVNSALQRAHATMADHLPARDRTGRRVALSDRERVLLHDLIDAWERADTGAVASLLTTDARLVMPPTPTWFSGRAAIVEFLQRHGLVPGSAGHYRAIAVGANRQPAMAVYRTEPGRPEHVPFALVLLRVETDGIAELTLFRRPEMFATWGLPPTAP
jgi:RNA polymerase sigma-70 factor (ECF subfamily)